jgi:fatty acid-binding protein DegV
VEKLIRIMADSTSDLSQEIIDKYNIGVAPLNIEIGGKTYRDKVDITPDRFYELLPTLQELPSTSMPSPEEYLSIIDKSIQEGYDQFLIICMSSGTSGSYQSAEIAKEYFYDRNPNSDFDRLVQFNEDNKKRVKHFLCVDDLNNLIKSGRLTNASAFIGKILRVKPIMTMKKSKGAIVAKERGWNKVLRYYVNEFKTRVDREKTNFIIIGYTSDVHIANALRDKVKEDTDFDGDIHIMQMGVAVGTHVGLGGLSMFFMEK